MLKLNFPKEEEPTMSLILNGARGGCRFCAVVWREFSDEGAYRNFYSNNNTNSLSLADIAKRFIINSLSLEVKEDIFMGYYKLSYDVFYEKTKWNGGGMLVLVVDTLKGKALFIVFNP